MLKTEVISVGIPATIPDVDWSVRDWSRFWPLRTAFPRIPLRRIPHGWEEENPRSACLNWDGSLQVDRSKLSSFRLRFLFNNLESRRWGVTVSGSSIPWRRGSNGSRRFAGEGRCAKEEEFPSDVEFLGKREFPTEVGIVGEERTPGEKESWMKEGSQVKIFWFGIGELWDGK